MNKQRIRAHNSVYSNTAAFSGAPSLDPFTGPNLARLLADPNRCFADGSDGSDGGGATPDDGGADPAPIETVPKHVMQKRIAEERKKAAAYSTQVEEMQAELASLREAAAKAEEERELAGKSAEEKARIRYEKETVKREKALEEARALIAEKDQIAAQRLATLQTERATREIGDALASKKAINAGKAAQYAMTQITISHNEDGSMSASYGDSEDVSIAEAVEEWLKDNDNFLPIPAGGASTRNGNFTPGKRSQADMSLDEIAQQAAEYDRARGRRY